MHVCPPAHEQGRPGFDRKITPEEINRLPIIQYSGRIEIITTLEALQIAVDSLCEETVIGFDTETKPAFRKGEQNPVAIMQCAGSTKVYIIQLTRLPMLHPLEKLLSTDQVIKAGVDLQQDITKLRRQLPCQYRGFVDVTRMAKEVDLKNFSMRALAAVLLGARIPKAVRTSNWARETLSHQQIRYAATDAWISRELYLRLSYLKAPRE